MTKLNILALAAMLSVAAPALAAGTTQPSKQMHHRHLIKSGERSTMHRHFASFRNESNTLYQGPGGRAWPGNQWAGAVDPMDSMAEAPFPSAPFGYSPDSYASWDGYSGTAGYNGYGGDNYYGAGYNDGRFSPEYAARNGFTCNPGTIFVGEDGFRHSCR